MTPHGAHGWPPLPYDDWAPTKRTLHRYVQIVGKVRMALAPFRNHWWHVTLLPATRGLTTGPMPAGDREIELSFDLLDHRLAIVTSDGQRLVLPLGPGRAVADLYGEIVAGLRHLGVEPAIVPRPYDLGDGPSFADDTTHDDYDADAVTRFWRVLVGTEHVLGELASRFNGKASPIQLFWHGLDLAHTRFSGRPAPVAADADPVTAEAYSHEVISFGFWAGDDRGTPYPAFYSYTSPEPDGLSDQPLEPAAAAWQDTGTGSLAVLPYGDVRAAADPRETLLAFYESAYLAGARLAGWDVDAFQTRRAP
jgi:hypothetical protein